MSKQRDQGAATTAAAAAILEPAGRTGQGAQLPGGGPVAASGPGWRRLRGRRWLVEVAVLAGFVAAGVAATWPRASYLAGTLPAGNDQAEYVWNMWWMAHQLIHPGNPWYTSYLAAPVGIQLGFDTLTPLLGLVLAPVTLLFGPSASFTVLAVLMPGLAGYAMYRLARLWLPGRVGPIAAGAFFGLSGMVAFQAWTHVHTAAGCVILPSAMEAAIRLRRDASIRRGVILGVVLGASMLVDQEFAVLAVILTALLLLPWLARQHGLAQVRAVAVGAVTAAVIASPQLIAMIQQAAGGRIAPKTSDYVGYAAQLPALFAPSPRLGFEGATGLGSIFQAHAPGEGLATFGVVLTALAAFGLVVGWRRRGARLLGALWLGSAALALGPVLYLAGHQYVPLAGRWHGLRVSLLMPFTWLLQVPGMSSFREPDRLAFVGLIGAALLAGAGVEWMRQHARPAIIAVVVLGVLEAGWPGSPHQFTMPTTLPAVDRPIAADHSGSVVVDVPFGINGIPKQYGKIISPFALVLATADGHPRAVSYTSWTVPRTINGIKRHAFYAGLAAARLGHPITPAQIAAARQDLRTLHVGWVLVWLHYWMAKVQPHYHLGYHYPAIFHYLTQTGFHLDHQADGVAVYRP